MRIAGFAAGPFQTNCYIAVNDEAGEAFVVDPGMGAYARAAEFAREEGVELTAVVLTHGHIDHTRDAAQFSLPTYIHPADRYMLDGGQGLSAQTLALHDAASMGEVEQVIGLPDGGEIEVAGIRLATVHAPGHSPGCVMLVADEVVFSGDVLFRGSIGRTDFDHSDPDAMRASLRGPVWDLDDSLAVLPGHGPATTVAHERATNPFVLDANRDRVGAAGEDR